MSPRLTTSDAAFVHMDTARTPMHVGGLMIFRLPARAGRHYLRDLLRDMRSAPVTAAPFSHVLHKGAWPGLRPRWSHADGVDLGHHVRRLFLRPGAGEAELCARVAQLHAQPLDPARPLWRCYLIEGLAGRRFAIYFKAHHAAFDGVGALRMIQRWLSDDPRAAQAPGPWATPDPAAAAARRTPSAQTDFLHRATAFVRSQLGSAGELAGKLREMIRPEDNPEGGVRSALQAPHTVFNVAVGPGRALAVRRLPLARIKELAAAADATVNDVLLAICGTALRRYLSARGALPSRALVASVPVGLPRADGRAGNVVTGFVCPLDTGQPDPRRRLATIRAVTRRTKAQLRGLSQRALEQFALLGLSPLILGHLTGLAARLPPFFNLVVSNVPCAATRLYLRRAELEALYPVSVLFDGHALNVTAVGYAGHIDVGLIACPEAVPDLECLAGDFAEALEQLAGSLAVATDRPPQPGSGSNESFGEPHSGQTQSSGRSSKRVPAGIPCAGIPIASS